MGLDRNNQDLMSDINVTPLVDVMLVLLIIFMVTAPMMMHGVKVDLPTTETKSVKTRQDPLILSITKEGDIFIEKHRVKLDDLQKKLQSIYANRRKKEIFLQADKAVSYGFVIQAMARVKAAGITRVGMITKPVQK